MPAGPCFKQTVTATIVTRGEERFVGTNRCLNAQDHCPRGHLPSGTGYELCKSVCEQPAHAEIAALESAGGLALGATLYLEGHTYACKHCADACDAAGIHSIIIGAPPARETFMPTLTDTLTERGSRYGDFKDQAVIADGLVDAMMVGNWPKLSPDQREALRVIANKIGRILNGDPDYSDSWHDIAGYATLVDKRLKSEGK